MPTTIQSSRNAQFPTCFAITPRQELIVTDGVNLGQYWDGVASATYRLGIVAPASASTTTLTGAVGNASTGTYVIYYRYKDADGNYSSLSPVQSLAAVAGDRFNHAGLVASLNSRVTHKEVLRSLVNDSATLYVVATITNATTTYSDTLSDVALAANTAVPILNSDGSANANRFDPPPLTRFGIPFFDRMFYFGVVTYRFGSVEVTNGSATVQGRGTQFTDQMSDWKFYVPGEATEYSVSSLNTSTQAVTLSATYGGSTNLFSDYAMRPNKLLRRRIYYSSALEPESVRATDYVIPADDGDDFTAGFDFRNSLFICEGARMWRLFMAAMQGRASENTKPGIGIQHVVYRGAINNRCVIRSNDAVYIMDQDGVYLFDGTGAKDISQPIQDFFREGRINWSASEWFFGSNDDAAEIVAWHVALGDGYLPHFALVYHAGLQRWECIEDYPWRLGCSTSVPVFGGWQPLYGGEFGKFYMRDGTLDGPTERTIRGTATEATLLTIKDDSSDAVLPSSPVGSPLVVVAGPAKGERRRIVAYSSSTFTLDQPFYEWPTTDTEYQVGGVPWTAKTGIYQFPAVPIKQVRNIVLVAEPTVESATIDVRRFLDHGTDPEEYVTDQDLGLGVSIDRDQEDVVLDMKRVQTRGVFSGRRHWRLDGYTHARLDNGRYVQVEIGGVQGMDQIKIYGMMLHGASSELDNQ